jgi:hypothetical protein
LTFDRGSSRIARATNRMIANRAVTLNATIRPAMRISVFMRASSPRAEAAPSRETPEP